MTEIRQLNLKKIELKYGSQVALAEIIKLSPSRVNHLLTGQRNIGEKAARKIEILLNKPSGWMDALHDEQDKKNIVDLSKYNDEENKLIQLLLDSLDSKKEKTQEKGEKTLDNQPVKCVGG